MTNTNQAIDLRDVTVCAADSIHPALAARALETSAAHCNFADAILFTHDAHEPVPPTVRVVPIPRLQSKEAYSTFMLKRLGELVSTPWVLVIQWDGYVLDPAAWSDTFFEFDYIGANWPFRTHGNSVGNGGFSLRSAKLLKALADERFPMMEGAAEDELICRTFRPQLEAEYGIRFAPPDVAARFAYEHERPGRPTFGFHAAFNMWRHVDDNTMMTMLRTLNERTFTSSEVLQLLLAYYELRKFPCMKVMYERYRRIWNEEEIVQRLLMTGRRDETVRECAALCAQITTTTLDGMHPESTRT